MNNKEEQSDKERKRIAKLKADELASSARDQVRSDAYLAKEKELEKIQNAKEAQRTIDRAAEEKKNMAAEKIRKEVYLAKEKKIAEELEARKFKK